RNWRDFPSWSWVPPLAHHLGRALDRAHDAHMASAAALEAGESVIDLGVGRLLLLVEKSGSRHDPAIDAVTALRHLLIHIGLLDRVRLLGRTEAGKCHDLAGTDGRDRRNAGADRLAV